jgi:hypothetical protein
MTDLLHRIKIFVYARRGLRTQYLLLRPAQGVEACWGPIQGNIAFSEKIETAVRREVLDDIGLVQPLDLIELGPPCVANLGIEDVVEWCFGFHAPLVTAPLRLGPRWADFRWAHLGEAYPALELEEDRSALLRLHARVEAA